MATVKGDQFAREILFLCEECILYSIVRCSVHKKCVVRSNFLYHM
jgi:hypothetical protein